MDLLSVWSKNDWFLSDRLSFSVLMSASAVYTLSLLLLVVLNFLVGLRYLSFPFNFAYTLSEISVKFGHVFVFFFEKIN